MDALPLYRQATLLGRFGGDLSRNTLAASIVKVGEAVQPIINLLRDHLFDADLVHGDETTVQVLKEPGKKAQTKSYLWAQATDSGPLIRLFGHAPGRGAIHADTLYARIKSGAVLIRIESMLLRYLHSVIPGSLLGKALHYLSAQWPKLSRYVENGAWPIDNNLCENAIRPFVIGRRHWLFADTVAGTHASANLYSLIETCKTHRIDPYGYLVSLFRRLPAAKSVDDFEALLPWRLAVPVAV